MVFLWFSYGSFTRPGITSYDVDQSVVDAPVVEKRTRFVSETQKFLQSFLVFQISIYTMNMFQISIDSMFLSHESILVTWPSLV